MERNAHLRIGRCNSVRTAIFSNLIYRFKIVSIQIPAAFAQVHQLILRFRWKCAGTQSSQSKAGKERQRQRTRAAGLQNTPELQPSSHCGTAGDPEGSGAVLSPGCRASRQGKVISSTALGPLATHAQKNEVRAGGRYIMYQS